MAETMTPEELARSIIPPNYRAETAQTGVMPPMEMVLSSRCAGSLRDAIAEAIRTAVSAEREACAKVADEMALAAKQEFGMFSARSAGAAAVALHLRAIRSRKEDGR